VILPDANLLIYAVNESLPQHEVARAWLEETLSGNESVAMPWICLLAFLRITTRGDIFAHPLAPERAVGYVDEWLQQPFVRSVVAGENHWAVLRNLLAASGMAANLTTDAHVAALALESGATVYSADNDFKRFAGVLHVNPLASA